MTEIADPLPPDRKNFRTSSSLDVIAPMSYRKSEICQLGFKQALLVEEACQTFPRHELFSLAQQLRNSSRSIVANYAESYVRQKYYPADYRKFLTYSQGNCDETKFWVELAREMGLVDEANFEKLMDGYRRLSIMIVRVLGRT
jgi:four helix bundle protein